jgi:hypothetical protein
MAWETIKNTINTRPEVWDSFTSRQLALITDLLNTHWHSAVAWKEAEICADGFVWDNKRQTLLDIPPEA